MNETIPEIVIWSLSIYPILSVISKVISGFIECFSSSKISSEPRLSFEMEKNS